MSARERDWSASDSDWESEEDTEGGRFAGRSLDDALSNACTALRARIGELHYEVIEEEEGGEVVIDAEIDPIAVLGLFLSEAFRAGEFAMKAQISKREQVIEGEISGEDVSVLTGSQGRGLDALQYLCNRILNRRLSAHKPVHLDVSGYKEKRAQGLRSKAEAAADEALRKRRPVRMGPHTPAARREIHLALADYPGVETESDGEGFIKKVIVRPTRWR